MAKKILFVVHRYAPFPGGSETNVKNMAEEMVRRGYEVTVLAYTNQGDLNGVAVTGDHSLAFSSIWDLIIVHGGDVNSQNFVHDNYSMIKAPVLYLIIKPSESDVCLKGLHNHKYLGYGTTFDYNLIDKYGLKNKARLIRYGIPIEDTVFEGIVNKPNLKMFVSIGGFAPHKQMMALANAYTSAKIDGSYLVLLGYDGGDIPQNTNNIVTSVGMDKRTVMNIVRHADALIMNSSEEGFGLVLLEAMMNKTPWIARDIAGAHDMRDYGTIYNTEDELIEILRNFERPLEKIDHAYNYVMTNHTIAHCVTDIEKVLDEHY